MNLGSCVLGTKLTVEFEDGYGTNTQRVLRAIHTCVVTAGVIPSQMASVSLHDNCFVCNITAVLCQMYLHLVAAILAHDGKTYTRINISPMMVTHTNDISVRFKTRDDGLLFATSNNVNDGYFKLYLDDGQGVLETNVHRQGTATVSIWHRLPLQ